MILIYSRCWAAVTVGPRNSQTDANDCSGNNYRSHHNQYVIVRTFLRYSEQITKNRFCLLPTEYRIFFQLQVQAKKL